MRSLALLAALMVTVPSHAGDWFLHKFGEERRYLRDWLAVCGNAGAGPCRAVQMAGDKRGKLTLGVGRDGSYLLSVWDEDMGDQEFEVQFRFDDGTRSTTPFEPGERVEKADGSTYTVNVMQTVTIPAEHTAGLVPHMKRATDVDIAFAGGSERYSLRGLTAALIAIDEKLGLDRAARSQTTASTRSSVEETIEMVGIDGFFMGLTGRYRSVGDARSEIEIASGANGLEQVSRYDGRTVERAPIDFVRECDGRRAQGSLGFMKVGDLCYGVQEAGDGRLVLIYLPRGNTLEYRRVQE